MRVAELAQDLKVSQEAVLTLLRAMGIPVPDVRAPVKEADVARVLARVERERRAGKDAVEAIQAAIEESKTPRRRRRRRAEPEPEVEAEAEGAEAEGAEAEEPAGDREAADAVAEAEEAPEAAAPESRDAVDEVAHAEEAPAADDEGDAPERAAAPAATKDAAARAPSAETERAPADEGGAETESEDSAAAEEEPSGSERRRVEVEGVDPPAEPVKAEAPAPARAGEPTAREGETSRPKRRLRMPSEAAAPESGDADGERRRRKRPEAESDDAPKPTPAASAGPGGQVRIQADGYTSEGRKKDRKKGKRRQRVDQDAVQDNIQRVMAELKGPGRKRRRKGGGQPSREEREAQEELVRQEAEEEAKTVRVNEFLTVAELSELIDVPSTELVGAAFKNLGLMVTINQRLDFDQIELLLDEFNFKAVREEEYGGVEEVVTEEPEDPEELEPRPPVVTVMGHVDHGKTLLLDSVRKTNVVAGESGGITQHIGAYHVELDDGRSIAFLDTPGHAAFTAMRARGADVTDIVVLVVAADDSIMPQTIEAISHAKNAGVPIVVAVNKMDLPAANAQRVKQELLQHEVTAEEFGGDVLVAEISAKTGMGIDDLLEKILLQAELLELKANPNRAAEGVVIESQLDVGKGAVATVLVQRGTLRPGDSFVCGKYDGRVRAMLDERGRPVEEATPGRPVQILGAGGVPQAGDTLQVMDSDRADQIAQTRQRLEREKQLRIKDRGLKLGDFAHFMAAGEVSTLPIIVKADVDGSVQAVADALEQLSTDEVRVEIIHRGVGAINESDVLLAETAGAVIIGFSIRPDPNARQLAEHNGVDIRLYEVIYEAVDEVRLALEGMLRPEERETVLGTAEVRAIFKISRVGVIAGCYVTDGVIDRKGQVRLVRDASVVYTGEVGSLKRFKEDVREVREGFECGIAIANFNDIKVGDRIECFQVEEVARTLAGTGSSAQG